MNNYGKVGGSGRIRCMEYERYDKFMECVWT